MSVDSSAEAIEYANARYSRPGLTFRVGDAMTFEDGPFDAVVSLETTRRLAIPLMEEIIGRLKTTRDKGSKLCAAKSRHACNRWVGLAEILGFGWH